MGQKINLYGAFTCAVLCVGAAVFGIGGTMLGDRAIANRVHGDTTEKREEFCTRNFQAANVQLTPDQLSGCVAEKKRGYDTAHAAHVEIRNFSYGTLALGLPLGFALYHRSRKPA